MKAGCLQGVAVCLVSIAFVLSVSAGATTGEPISIQIEKSFDHGMRVDHRITASTQDLTVITIFSQHRQGGGSDKIDEAHLSYLAKPREKGTLQSSQEMQRIMSQIIQAIHDKFGKDVELNSFSASGLFNVTQIEEKNFQAFTGYAPWQSYLSADDPNQFTQWAVHEMVVKRWRDKDVYAPVIGVFHALGYTLELSGFEKLFVFRADQFGRHSQSTLSSINPEDRFPYPGVVHFSVRPY